MVNYSLSSLDQDHHQEDSKECWIVVWSKRELLKLVGQLWEVRVVVLVERGVDVVGDTAATVVQITCIDTMKIICGKIIYENN